MRYLLELCEVYATYVRNLRKPAKYVRKFAIYERISARNCGELG